MGSLFSTARKAFVAFVSATIAAVGAAMVAGTVFTVDPFGINWPVVAAAAGLGVAAALAVFTVPNTPAAATRRREV